MIKVYTNLESFKSNPNVEVNHYSKLSDSFIAWVDNAIKTNECKSTEPEREFKRILQSQKAKFECQTFFRINNKNYFLDFFLPDINIAIEINGTSHNKKIDYDFLRDKDFESIGIKTIRISNRSVYDKNILKNINRYIKNSLNGISDVTDYFKISPINSINNKLTYNQKSLFCVIDKIKKCNKNSRVLIKTDMTYILSVLRKELLCSDNNVVNLDFIRYFFKIVEDNGLLFDVLYDGNFDNLKGYIGTLARKSQESDFINNNDCVILVNKEEVNKYNKLNYTKTMSLIAEELKKDNLQSGVYKTESESLVVMGDSVVVASCKLKNGDSVISFYNIKSPDDIQKLKEGKIKIDKSAFHVSILLKDCNDFDRLLSSINNMKSLM